MRGSHKGRVTVGMLTYNAERTLAASIESVLTQTHQDLVLVISDDASTDGTRAMAETYAARDPRIRLRPQPHNVGGITNFNSVVPLSAETEYFVWFSDHDRWHPRFLEACVAALDARPEAVLSYPKMHEESLDGLRFDDVRAALDTRGLDQLARLVTAAWAVPANTGAIYGVMRSNLIVQLHAYPDIYPHTPAPDVFLLLELAALGEFLHIPEDLYTLLNLGVGHNSPERYLRRLRLIPRNEAHAAVIAGRMSRMLWQSVSAHSSRPRRSAFAYAVAGASILKNYGFLFPLLVRLGAASRRTGLTGRRVVPPAATTSSRPPTG